MLLVTSKCSSSNKSYFQCLLPHIHSIILLSMTWHDTLLLTCPRQYVCLCYFQSWIIRGQVDYTQISWHACSRGSQLLYKPYNLNPTIQSCCEEPQTNHKERESGGEECLTAAAAKSLQSYPTLCDPIEGSSPGSPVPGILQASILEWVAISFSSAWKWKVKVKSLSPVRLLATPWTAAHQAPPSMGFSRQEYWSGVPLPSPS